MTTPPTQPAELSGWDHFIRSNYVTWFTDWLLGFGGKSAHIILTATMLYMSAQLFPGVNTPDALDLTVFLVQMFALDMGGMGLASLARQARAEGNETGADKAQQLSRWLIGIMIASIVAVCLEQAVHHILHENKEAQVYIDAIKIIVEVILVVARAICAVLYGPVIHALNEGATTYQQDMQNLQQENENLATTVVTLQQQLQASHTRARDALQQVEGQQEELSRLQTKLSSEQERSAALQADMESGTGDLSTLRRNLNAATVEAEALRTQLSGRQQELESLKQMLAGNQEFQESRVQQLLLSEQKQVEHLRKLLESEQESATTLRKLLNATKLQVIDLTGKLETVNREMAKLQNADHLVKDLSTKLEQRDREFAVVQADLLTAKSTITSLQKAVDETANLPGKLREKEEKLAGILAELQSTKLQIKDLKSANKGPAKLSDQTAKNGNITPIETAKSNRISHAEVLAYMKTNPTLKRADVAANLGISERKVYDAVAWGKEQENAVADA